MIPLKSMMPYKQNCCGSRDRGLDVLQLCHGLAAEIVWRTKFDRGVDVVVLSAGKKGAHLAGGSKVQQIPNQRHQGLGRNSIQDATNDF